jgi:WD40 repeat protein
VVATVVLGTAGKPLAFTLFAPKAAASTPKMDEADEDGVAGEEEGVPSADDAPTAAAGGADEEGEEDFAVDTRPEEEDGEADGEDGGDGTGDDDGDGGDEDQDLFADLLVVGTSIDPALIDAQFEGSRRHFEPAVLRGRGIKLLARLGHTDSVDDEDTRQPDKPKPSRPDASDAVVACQWCKCNCSYSSVLPPCGCALTHTLRYAPPPPPPPPSSVSRTQRWARAAPQGKLACLLLEGGELHRWSFHKSVKDLGKQRVIPQGSGQQPTCMCWASGSEKDGRVLVGTSEGRLTLVALESMADLATLPGHSAPVSGCVWQGGGGGGQQADSGSSSEAMSTAVSCSWDATLRLWSIQVTSTSTHHPASSVTPTRPTPVVTAGVADARRSTPTSS